MSGADHAAAAPLGCGDPTCDTCHPPRTRCEACGALHSEAEVPFCSLACALAVVRARRGDGSGPLPQEGDIG